MIGEAVELWLDKSSSSTFLTEELECKENQDREHLKMLGSDNIGDG